MPSTNALTSSEINAININCYITLISFTLLAYEYFLMFTREIERFWSSKRLSLPAILFFLNRYFTLLGNVPVVFQTFWYSTAANKQMICHGLESYSQYFVGVIQIIVSMMMIIRVYALYEHSRRVLALLVGVAIGATVVACWCLFSASDTVAEYPLAMGCSAPVGRKTALRFGGAWGGMLVLDILIFAMTIFKSFALHQKRGPSILGLMVRDGSIYFGVMAATNTANILTFLYGGVYTRGIVTTFMNATSSVMITRLMLNLRDPALLVIPEDYQGSKIRFGISPNVPPVTLHLVGTGNETVFTADHTRFEDNMLDGDIEQSTMTRPTSRLTC